MKVQATSSASLAAAQKATWPTCWDNQPAAPEEADTRALISRCRVRALHMQGKILEAKQNGQLRHASRLPRRYLMSYSARLDALSRAYEQKVGPLSKAQPDDLVQLAVAAGAVSAWKGSGEKAVAYPEPKRGGGYRLVRKHGLLQYALEVLSVAAAKPLAQLLDTQFLPEGGIPKLNGWLGQRLADTELVITVDIPRCFDVMKRSSVADNLHLPWWVVKRVLFDPMDQAILCTQGLGGSDLYNLVSNVQVSSLSRGIPQGSPLAQLASEIVIALVLQAVAAVGPGVHVASQGDNLIFLLEDASSKEAVVHALTSAVAEHFGMDVSGELTCRIEFAKPSTGFRFCRRTYRYTNAGLRISLPPTWVEDFATKTLLRIADAYADKDNKEFDRIERSIKGWLRHSPKTDAVIDEAASLLAHAWTMRK